MTRRRARKGVSVLIRFADLDAALDFADDLGPAVDLFVGDSLDGRSIPDYVILSAGSERDGRRPAVRPNKRRRPQIVPGGGFR